MRVCPEMTKAGGNAYQTVGGNHVTEQIVGRKEEGRGSSLVQAGAPFSASQQPGCKLALCSCSGSQQWIHATTNSSKTMSQNNPSTLSSVSLRCLSAQQQDAKDTSLRNQSFTKISSLLFRTPGIHVLCTM